MSIDIRLPNITAKDEAGQLIQIKGYLQQLAGQLNWALNTIDSGSTGSVVDAKGMPISKSSEKDDPAGVFGSIKGFIIKSADIVNAYYEEIDRKLEGKYVAEATFPGGSAKYIEETTKTTVENSEGIKTLFSNKQTIESNINEINEVLQTDDNCTKILGSSAWVKIGKLDYDTEGFPYYGMEVGQVNEENGKVVYRRFAQYRSDGVHLFDQNGIEVVEISSAKMIIKTGAEFKGKLKHGGFEDSIIDNGSIVTRWVGGE